MRWGQWNNVFGFVTILTFYIRSCTNYNSDSILTFSTRPRPSSDLSFVVFPLRRVTARFHPLYLPSWRLASGVLVSFSFSLSLVKFDRRWRPCSSHDVCRQAHRSSSALLLFCSHIISTWVREHKMGDHRVMTVNLFLFLKLTDTVFPLSLGDLGKTEGLSPGK